MDDSPVTKSDVHVALEAAWAHFKYEHGSVMRSPEEERLCRAVFRWAFADGYSRGADHVGAVAKALLETD